MSERRAGLEKENAEADPSGLWGRPLPPDKIATASGGSAGVVASACMEEKIVGTRETPAMRGRGSQRELREGPTCGWCPAQPCGVADRLVVLKKPGNAGGGKGPDFWRVSGRDQQSGDWLCLSTPITTRRSRKELYLSAKMAMFSESRPM